MEETQPPEQALQCAVEFLEVLPLIMGSLHAEMRRETAATLTMTQFRLLSFLNFEGTVSVSKTAEFLHLGLPATSKIIEGLAASKAISRKGDPLDRRRVLIEITPKGRGDLLATRAISHEHLAKLLAPLSPENGAKLLEVLRALRPIFVKIAQENSCPLPPSPSPLPNE